jgi:hypothetical protein
MRVDMQCVMESPPSACPDCGGTSLSRNVAIQDDANGYIEIERRCADCFYRWREAHQNGRFISVIRKSQTRAERDVSEAELEKAVKEFEEHQRNPKSFFILLRPEACPFCSEINGRWPDQALEHCRGHFLAGNIEVDYKYTFHKECMRKLPGEKYADRFKEAEKQVRQFAANEARKDSRYRPNSPT